MLPAAKDVEQKVVLGVLGASVCQVGRCLLLMLRTFRALGNPCRLLGRTLRRRIREELWEEPQEETSGWVERMRGGVT